MRLVGVGLQLMLFQSYLTTQNSVSMESNLKSPVGLGIQLLKDAADVLCAIGLAHQLHIKISVDIIIVF